jgi:transcriptional regulator
MYVQTLFEETRVHVMHELMQRYALASLVLLTPEGMDANSLPIEVDMSSGEFGTLRCHFGRTNPVWKSLINGMESMAIFHGPNAYISPRWYVAGQRSKRVLPSWNFAVVHAYGTPRIVDDSTWLLKHLTALAEQNESRLAEPWSLAEAPPDFVAQSAEHLIGMEIPITKLVGKWFTSQQRTTADRESLTGALRAHPHDISAATAELIELVDRSNG